MAKKKAESEATATSTPPGETMSNRVRRSMREFREGKEGEE